MAQYFVICLRPESVFAFVVFYAAWRQFACHSLFRYLAECRLTSVRIRCFLNRGHSPEHKASTNMTQRSYELQQLIMAAIWNRAGHCIFALWFLSSFFLLSLFFLSFSFPRLISAVEEWMSTILPHMMWPQCKFRMHVRNVQHVARWKCRTQKIAKIAIWAPSYNFVGRYLRNYGTCRQPEKKLVKQQYLI